MTNAWGNVPIDRVRGVVVHGNIDLSTGLLRELLWRSVAVVWCSGRGSVVGYARSAHAPNGQARVRQHVASDRGVLDVAREFVAAKIANQATLLRRNSRSGVADAVKEIRRMGRRAGSAPSVAELIGWEGAAASIYFRHWASMLAPQAPVQFVEEWKGRQGRGADDPCNVALNYVYGILLGEVTRAVLPCGLDPHAGFVHSSSRNKPALALDLMEEFRPLVADSVVIGVINNGELLPSMFTGVGDVAST